MWAAKALTLPPIITNVRGPIIHRLRRLHHIEIRLLGHLGPSLKHGYDAVLHTLVLDEVVLPREHPVAVTDVAGDIADGILRVVRPGQGVNRVVHDSLSLPWLRADTILLDAARVDCAWETEMLGADVVFEVDLGDEVFSAGI